VFDLGLLLAGGFLIISMLLCCGFGSYFVNGVMNEETLAELRDNPRLIAEIGPVQKAEVQFFKSMAIDDDDTWVYLMTGAQGSVEVTVYEIDGPDGDLINKAVMRKKDGSNETILDNLQPIPLNQP
jgi:hypothetical protein